MLQATLQLSCSVWPFPLDTCQCAATNVEKSLKESEYLFKCKKKTLKIREACSAALNANRSLDLVAQQWGANGHKKKENIS